MSPVLKKKEKETEDKQNWYKDRHQRLEWVRNVLAVFSLASVLICLVGVLIVNHLLPHKSVEPFVIQIDQKSGITQTVEPITQTQISSNEALQKYFIVKYVRSRETVLSGGFKNTYNYENYLSVNGMTAAASQALEEYAKIINPTNVDSYFNRFTASGARTVKIKSIQFGGVEKASHKATVRVLIEENGAMGARGIKEIHLIINMEYSFVELKATAEQSYINPLGFLVSTYRIDEEVVKE